jgi:hypothetical protein
MQLVKMDQEQCHDQTAGDRNIFKIEAHKQHLNYDLGKST